VEYGSVLIGLVPPALLFFWKYVFSDVFGGSLKE
jgi:hypothetical protein